MYMLTVNISGCSGKCESCTQLYMYTGFLSYNSIGKLLKKMSSHCGCFFPQFCWKRNNDEMIHSILVCNFFLL